jgi:hypothetical protein
VTARRAQGVASATARRALRAVAAGLVVIAVTAAALGWLDVMRRAGILHGSGPKLREALALQRLAGGAAQPLGRFALAWLPAGVAGGAVLALIGMRRRIPRGALLFCGCAALLLAFGAAADAITASEPLSAHLAAQPGRASIWAAAALAGVGGLVVGRARS